MIDDGRDAVRAVHGVESKIAAAGLNAGGHALVQERIPVDGLGARYVRLRWLDRAPTIASVEIEVQANQNPATPVADTRQWHDALVARVGHAAGEYLFETTGAYPVDRLRFNVPQLNTHDTCRGLFANGGDGAVAGSGSGRAVSPAGRCGRATQPPVGVCTRLRSRVAGGSGRESRWVGARRVDGGRGLAAGELDVCGAGSASLHAGGWK